MQSPLITIVTVVYNNYDKIENTILSVLSQRDYYDRIEYIIIDGGSTDGTVDIIEKYSAKIDYWVSEPDKGVYDAMNKAIKVCNGEWICFMNSGDCFTEKDIISKIAHLFIGNCHIIYGDTIVINEYGANVVKAKDASYLKYNMPFCHQSTFVKSCYMKDALFDTTFRLVADYNFFYKCFNSGLIFQYIPISISIFDSTEGLTASNKKKMFKEIIKVRKKDDTLIQRCLLMGKYYRYRCMELLKSLFPSFVKRIRMRNNK